MERFNRVLRGYDPEEVNNFLDQIITRIESMISEINAKDREIEKLQKSQSNPEVMERLAQYERMEDTLNRAIIMAQKTSDQLKVAAHKESEIMLDDAKKNASRIVNDALQRAETIENDAMNLQKNVTIFKRRLKSIIEQQLEIVDEIEKVEL